MSSSDGPNREPEPELPPRIGPYRPLRLLGEGGAAIVYLAEPPPPLARRVAIKVLRPGAVPTTELERFQLELTALSALGHANVAAVFDAGVWEGRPYFVLEWVENGLPLNEHCRHHRLSLRARLELFLQACAGVQHAHDRGILHRDVTPANLLVATGEPSVVKVIDFGLARALGMAGQATASDGPSPIVGTLAYLAPEQVTSPDLLDVRSDVHALGLVLFELLTGERARATSWAELEVAGQLLQVAAGVDERPSERGGDAHGAIRDRDLRGPLDWIVGKALAVDLAERYASVADLAADVRRHLAGDVVEAGPRPLGYRLRGWLRKHRAAVAAVCMVVGSMLGGSVAAAHFASAANQEAAAADEARMAAERATARFDLLADGARYRQALATAETLWPVGPELVPRIDRWLQDFAEPLVARLPLYRATLAELMALAAPSNEAVGAGVATDQELQRSPFHPIGHRLHHLATWRQVLASSEPAVQAAFATLGDEARANYDAVLTNLRAALPDIGADEAGREPAGLVLRDQVLWRDVRQLVLGVESMAAEAGLLAQVRQRRADSLVLAERSLHAPSAVAAWAAARDRVAADPRFPAVDLRPIAGLMPVGPDPHSGLEEFVHLATGRAVQRGDDGQLELAPDFGIVLVLLPPARAWVGAQASDPAKRHFDPWALPNEGPVRQVELPPMLVSKFELTVSQAHRLGHRVEVLGETVCVDCNEAERLAADAGLAVMDEDLWEYACRANTSTPWWSGDDVASLSSQGERVAAENLASMEFGVSLWSGSWLNPGHRDGYRHAAPPAALLPNPFGLHHMHGNLSEVCRARDDGAVCRGGGYGMAAVDSRSSSRLRIARNSKLLQPTVRLARTIAP